MLMNCSQCNIECRRFGKHRNGLQRFQCPVCRKTYTEDHARLFGAMMVAEEKALLGAIATAISFRPRRHYRATTWPACVAMPGGFLTMSSPRVQRGPEGVPLNKPCVQIVHCLVVNCYRPQPFHAARANRSI